MVFSCKLTLHVLDFEVIVFETRNGFFSFKLTLHVLDLEVIVFETRNGFFRKAEVSKFRIGNLAPNNIVTGLFCYTNS